MRHRRALARIDLVAIRHNLHTSVAKLPKDVKKLAVVKADAYGHGAIEVARYLADEVEFFAVATAEEAIELRDVGITTPILILGNVWPEDYIELINNEVRIPVFSLKQAKEISSVAKMLEKDAFVHIKVDSGMHRIGFMPSDESVAEVKEIKHLPHINCEGIFTHFARADEEDKSYTKVQYDCFVGFADAVDDGEEKRIPLRHAANSATAMEMPEYALDMVRIGISMYGHYPSDEVSHDAGLIPAMTLESEVIMVKDVPAGEGIGYNHTAVLTEPRKIATIPVGYADGYPRSLSNAAYVLIKGKKAPILGRICMDQFMCDVTDLPDVHEGDKVVLVGKSGDEEITMEMLGKISGRFNYEFMCEIGRRFHRIYKMR